VLDLPARAIGQLQWVDRDESVHRAPAAGTVTVPPGAHLRLLLNGEDPVDLGVLAGLPLDGLFLAQGVDAAELDVVASLTGLCELVIDTQDLDTSPLAALTGLRRLRIRCRDLAPLPGLRELVLHASALTDLDALLAATGLRGLRLDGANLDGSQRSRLATLPDLATLSLAVTLGDGDVSWLAAMPALTTLDLRGEQAVTEAGLHRLREAKPGLRLNGTWLARS
jgi:hypothetical protein